MTKKKLLITFITLGVCLVIGIVLTLSLTLGRKSAMTSGGNTDISTNSAATQPQDTSKYWGEEGTGYDIDWEGTGTEEDPFLITTAEELAGLSYRIYYDIVADQSHKFTSGSISYYYSGVYFKQVSNIDVSKYWWQPIGIYCDRSGNVTSSYRTFSGNYNGGGYTISGVFTKLKSTFSNEYQGLFGLVQGENSTNQAVIQNLGIINSNIQGRMQSGSIVGSATIASITNCYNTGKVNSNSSQIGGIVGYAINSTITNCYNIGAVSGATNVGGILGSGNKSILKYCYNTGVVSGTTKYELTFVGGLVGFIRNYSVITNCYNTGVVSGPSSLVGGILGDDFGNTTVTNCYNTGNISGDNYVGGIMGGFMQSSMVTNCYNTGAVSGRYVIGGIAGCVSDAAIVTNCYNTGNVNGTVSQYGGIIGKNLSSGVINNCYYGGDCTLSIGIGDGTGNTSKDSSLSTNAKSLNWYKNSSKWNSNYIWDFDNDWEFRTGENGGYPILIIPIVNLVVTADANGGNFSATTGWSGSGNSAIKKAILGDIYGTFPSPKREGYIFEGWYLNDNLLDMDALMTWYNLQEDTYSKDKGYKPIVKEGDVYMWSGETHGYWNNGSFVTYSYSFPLETNGVYRISYIAKNEGKAGKSTTKIGPKNNYRLISGNLLNNVDSQEWAYYECVFVVTNGINFTLDMGYNYNQNTYFKNIKLERMDLCEESQKILPTSVVETAQDHTIVAKWTEETWEYYAADTYARGIGTQRDPYIITTGYELGKLAKDSRTNDLSGKYYRLGASIDLAKYTWNPIGNKTFNVFCGHFDGNLMAIRNMRTTDNVVYTYNSGLFGSAGNAVIKNVYLLGGKVTGYFDSGVVLGVCSGSYKPIVQNCLVDGVNISIGSSGSVGGIVGACAIISGCEYRNGIISRENRKDTNGYVGGIVGGQVTGYTTTDCSALNVQVVCASATQKIGIIIGSDGGQSPISSYGLGTVNKVVTKTMYGDSSAWKNWACENYINDGYPVQYPLYAVAQFGDSQGVYDRLVTLGFTQG